MNMDANSTSVSDGGMMVMMTPFLHFLGGDYLLFQAWKPTSRGATAGACIGLFLFALFDRWVNATFPVIEYHLKQRASRNIPMKALSGSVDPTSRRTSSETTESPPPDKKPKSLPKRTFPPFMATVDIPRGILYAFQRLLGFGLMLSVMTFNAGYIISILVGLGLGEILFGRISMGVPRHDH